MSATLYDFTYFNLCINKEKLWRKSIEGSYAACYTYIYSFERITSGTGLFIYPDLKIVDVELDGAYQDYIQSYSEAIKQDSVNTSIAIEVKNNCIIMTIRGLEDAENMGSIIPIAILGMTVSAKTIVDDSVTYRFKAPTSSQFASNPVVSLNSLSKPNFRKYTD